MTFNKFLQKLDTLIIKFGKIFGLYKDDDCDSNTKHSTIQSIKNSAFPKFSIISVPEIKKESPINNLINQFYVTGYKKYQTDKFYYMILEVFNNENIKFGKLSINLNTQSYCLEWELCKTDINFRPLSGVPTAHCENNLELLKFALVDIDKKIDKLQKLFPVFNEIKNNNSEIESFSNETIKFK